MLVPTVKPKCFRCKYLHAENYIVLRVEPIWFVFIILGIILLPIYAKQHLSKK